jgi:hypothetical protein
MARDIVRDDGKDRSAWMMTGPDWDAPHVLLLFAMRAAMMTGR